MRLGRRRLLQWGGVLFGALAARAGKAWAAGYYNLGSFFRATPKTPTLWAWGWNETGRLGIGTIVDKSSPVQVGALTNWAWVATSCYHAAAVKTDGTLWTWGLGAGGGLGTGTVTDQSSPVQVGALTNWARVFASYGGEGNGGCSVGLKTDGTLWAWGTHAVFTTSSPVQIGAATDWVRASGALHTLAIKSNGSLFATGSGESGQLGIGTLDSHSSPVQVGALTTWATCFAASQSSFAIKTDGTLWAWGDNTSGLLGLGNTNHKSSPVQVGSLTNWAAIALSDCHAVAVKSDGTLWAWGANASGQLGHGDTTARSSPVQVGALTDWSAVTAGGGEGTNVGYTMALRSDGTLWSWGSGLSGELGSGLTSARSSPVQVGSSTNWLTLVDFGSVGFFGGVRDIANCSFAIKNGT